VTTHALALALRVPASRFNDIVLERRAVTADTALRLACNFGGDGQTWINLQAEYDLKTAKRDSGPAIDREVTPRAA
jgi:antitoxin HigA-1